VQCGCAGGDAALGAPRRACDGFRGGAACVAGCGRHTARIVGDRSACDRRAVRPGSLATCASALHRCSTVTKSLTSPSNRSAAACASSTRWHSTTRTVLASPSSSDSCQPRHSHGAVQRVDCGCTSRSSRTNSSVTRHVRRCGSWSILRGCPSGAKAIGASFR
jgi:hypothetical protein